MDIALTRIDAKSRRQAMDWSLVLVSQGIETTIQPPLENGRWTLVIPAQEGERAFKALRQYRAENRDWPWRQKLPWRKARFNWLSVGWAIFLMTLHALSGADPHLRDAGIMNSAKVIAGQWWLVFTAMTLHADLGHLATNLSIGVVLMGLTMGLYGTGIGLLAAYVAGAMGNVASLLLNAKPFEGLGASGMVMGALGLLAAQSFLPEMCSGQSRKYIIAGMAAGIMLFVLFGLAPGSDIAAHLGGFVGGLVIGSILVQIPLRLLNHFIFNLLGGILVITLVVTTWWLAFSHR